MPKTKKKIKKHQKSSNRQNSNIVVAIICGITIIFAIFRLKERLIIWSGLSGQWTVDSPGVREHVWVEMMNLYQDSIESKNELLKAQHEEAFLESLNQIKTAKHPDENSDRFVEINHEGQGFTNLI